MLARSSAVRAALRGRSRGFTLTELLIVVVLIGVLAAIGIASFRRAMLSSKTTEAAAVIQAIRAAQESYRAENQRYFDVSGTENRWYPSGTFGSGVKPWSEPSHPDYADWQRLGPAVSRGVQFGYLVHAGVPGAALPKLVIDTPLEPPTQPWYVVQARADTDDNGVFCDVVAANINSDLVIRNQGE